MLKPELAALAPELEGKVRVAFCDVDAEGEIAAAFNVRGIPALFLMKDGEIIDSWTGFMPRAAVKARLEQHVGKIGG
jgi:putative thioredoxin